MLDKMQAGQEQAGWKDKCKAMSLGQRAVHVGLLGPAGASQEPFWSSERDGGRV